MLEGLVVANSLVFSELKDSEESPRGILFIDPAVMWALNPQEMCGRISL